VDVSFGEFLPGLSGTGGDVSFGEFLPGLSGTGGFNLIEIGDSYMLSLITKLINLKLLV